jgi:hypothetical protein
MPLSRVQARPLQSSGKATNGALAGRTSQRRTRRAVPVSTTAQLL